MKNNAVLLLSLLSTLTFMVLSGCKKEKAWTYDCSEVATDNVAEWSYDVR